MKALFTRRTGEQQRCLVASLVAVLLAAPTGLAHSQSDAYPIKPVRLVVGQAPGGATDIVGRLVAQKMTDVLGQNVLIDNRTGAAGSIAASIVAKSPPDGYTLLLVSSSYSINPSLFPKLPFDPQKDLLPVTLLAEAPFLLVVHPALPARNVRDLVALAKTKWGELTFASGGTGSSGHLAGELFQSLAGVKLVHVPYKGAGPALVDVMAGQVHFMFASVLSSLSHVRSNKLRALAVTGAKRSSALPEMPTVSEAGVRGYSTASWYGLLAPAGTRPGVVTRLAEAAKKAVSSPDVRNRMLADGAEPEGSSPEAFQRQLASEIEKWRKVVKSAGISAE